MSRTYRRYEFGLINQTPKVWFVEVPGRPSPAGHDASLPRNGVIVMLGTIYRRPSSFIELAIPEDIAATTYKHLPLGPVVDPSEIEKAKELGNDINHPSCRRSA